MMRSLLPLQWLRSFESAARHRSFSAAAAELDRVLTLDEWARLGEWALTAAYPFGPFIRALMLSGQRLSDVAGMRWDEIEGGVWVIPAARHKSKKRHEVPLSAALANLLATLERHDEH